MHVCLDMFYLLIFGEIDMEGHYVLHECIYVGNIKETLPKGPTKGHQGGPKHCLDTSLARDNNQ